jgi:hypothetical protein
MTSAQYELNKRGKDVWQNGIQRGKTTLLTASQGKG